MGHIDYYFTVLSSWAVLGGQRFTQITKARVVSVVFKTVDIGQLFMHAGGQLPKNRRDQMDVHLAEQR